MTQRTQIEYSEKYQDAQYEYRHVILSDVAVKQVKKMGNLLSEAEWRNIGVQQSRGWVHYALHQPEPHILLFRRPLGTHPSTGEVDPVLEMEAKKKYLEEQAMYRQLPLDNIDKQVTEGTGVL
eukprot:383346_1